MRDSKNNEERAEDMSNVLMQKNSSSKKIKDYNQEQRNDLIKKIAHRRKGVLSKLSKT